MSGSAEEAWAGQHMPPVQISMTGRSRFVVLRATDTASGRQRFLVRTSSPVPASCCFITFCRPSYRCAWLRAPQQLPAQTGLSPAALFQYPERRPAYR